jgi:demethylmenaquinone methyltransferase / 2-methoxy-6-polyprenyl-1,4-benzoquinol methylase
VSGAPHPVLKKYYGQESDRRSFVSALFDKGARHYDWINALGSMGSGRFYRRWILAKYGLRAGMKLLDVATGTGLVAQAATSIVRESGAVIGLDPSIGMLQQARKTLAIPLVQGTVEELPFAADHFDFLSMGYALRHVADLGVAFRQCLRVLKPGGSPRRAPRSAGTLCARTSRRYCRASCGSAPEAPRPSCSCATTGTPSPTASRRT